MTKKFDVKIEDSKVKLQLDTNADGQPVVSLNLHLSEALQEAVARGEAVEGAKVVDFKFELTKLVLKIDTDKDGEELLDLEIDLAEAFDEVSSAVSKKDAE